MKVRRSSSTLSTLGGRRGSSEDSKRLPDETVAIYRETELTSRYDMGGHDSIRGP